MEFTEPLMKTNFSFFLLLFLFFAMSCENTSGPEKKDNPIDPPLPTSCDELKTTNDYTWRIDTVGHWPSDLGGVYAFSDSDAYAMGHIDDGKSAVFAGLHWDGKNWREITSGTGTEIGHTSVAVIGDQNMMVSVGYAGVANPTPVLAEFDNRTKKWKATKFSGFGAVTSIWTDGSGLFLAGGSDGKIFRKNGYTASWETLSNPFTGQINYLEKLPDGELWVATTDANFSVEFWRQKNNQWQKVYDGAYPDSTRYIQNGFDRLQGFDLYYCSVTKKLELFAFSTRVLTLTYIPEKDRFLDYGGPYTSDLGYWGRAAKVFAPNDIWFWGRAWLHWDGKTLKRFQFPGYSAFITGKTPSRTKSGKIFLPLNNEGQTWLVAQGTPNF